MTPQNDNCNTYEEARNLRLEENKRRLNDLGILNLSKTLSTLTAPDNKTNQSLSKPTSQTAEVIEPRRSSRNRKTVSSNGNDADILEKPLRERSRASSSSCASYAARPSDEVKVASYEDRIQALEVAEEFQSCLQSGNPSFVKSMVRSHVYSCFWLGLPTDFCKDHLPEEELELILEDENGATYDAKYHFRLTGLRGGWREFALDHKLDDGDAVVFELVQKDRFKVYIFRVSSLQSSETDTIDIKDKDRSPEKNVSEGRRKTARHSDKSRKSKKAKASNVDEFSDTEELEPENDMTGEEI
ncbi:putative B3 domain-containing protein At5g58280 [Mercurialis annua]|uniref:putative B3 domain-containing protein At5g58280 n=1 Tax=Mercurialis annua TaxID=3986 RepID=UPI002160287D|nr:putative B3 domain-containing protein At5g58280 [Mercurialis annua]